MQIAELRNLAWRSHAENSGSSLHPCFYSSWISVAPSPGASGIRPLSPVTPSRSLPCSLPFTRHRSCPATIAQMVKLLLEPLAIFILLSGWRSIIIHSTYPSGVEALGGRTDKKRHQWQQAPRSWVLVVPRPLEQG